MKSEFDSGYQYANRLLNKINFSKVELVDFSKVFIDSVKIFNSDYDRGYLAAIIDEIAEIEKIEDQIA
jgi:hypothetical protein